MMPKSIKKSSCFIGKIRRNRKILASWNILEAEIWNFQMPNPLFLHMSLLVRWRYKNFTKMRLGQTGWYKDNGTGTLKYFGLS